MKNAYGVVLDRNGYAPSVVCDGDRCYICGRSGKLERHEVYHGANRTKSKNLGCWVTLCSECHNRLHHEDARVDMALKARVQAEVMRYYGWTEDAFRDTFGKNYL